jgi:hypothetical protein
MTIVFWHRSRVLIVKLMQEWNIIRSAVRCELLKKLFRAIQEKLRGMLTSGVVLFHDDEQLQTAASTRELQEHFYWELSDYLLYCSDLTPNDYNLFTYLNNCLGHSSSTVMS